MYVSLFRARGIYDQDPIDSWAPGVWCSQSVPRITMRASAGLFSVSSVIPTVLATRVRKLSLATPTADGFSQRIAGFREGPFFCRDFQ
jgi:hypothetical protein